MYTAPISRLVITVDNSSTSSDVQSSLSAVDERRVDGGSGGHSHRKVLTFVAGLPLPHVRCVAAGGFPPPSVSIFLDHHDITGRFDVVQRSSRRGLHGLQVTSSDPTVVPLPQCHCTVTVFAVALADLPQLMIMIG